MRAERKDKQEDEITIGPFPLMQPTHRQDEPELTIRPDQILDTPEPNNQTVDTSTLNVVTPLMLLLQHRDLDELYNPQERNLLSLD